MDSQLEIIHREGLSKHSRIDFQGKQVHFPCLTDICILMGKDENIRHSISLNDEKNSLFQSILVFHPSTQFLEYNTEKNSPDLEKMLSNKAKLTSDTIKTIHILPADVLISTSDDLTEYFSFLDDYINILGLNAGSCGIRVPNLSLAKLEQLSTYIKRKKLLLASLSSTNNLLTNPARMSEYIGKIHNTLPPRLLIHAPAIEPSWYPLLAYAGVDLFDTTGIETMTNRKYYLTSMGSYDLSSIHDNNSLPCDCWGCKSILESKKEYRSLLYHNTRKSKQLLHIIRSSIKQQSLRDIVNGSFRNLPSATSLLRKIDNDFGFLLEERLTVNKSTRLHCSYEMDLIRPEVLRFVQRSRLFTPSPLTQLCLIIPCSRRKPYSSSKSHQALKRTIKSVISNKLKYRLSEVIITSPLGVVPRELEKIYPAAHYDIPVTGNWSELEINRSVDSLRSYLSKLPDETIIIAHVPDIEGIICERALDNRKAIFTCKDGRITSNESLENLENEIRSIRNSHLISTTSEGNRQRELHLLRTIANYQFGNGSGDYLISNDDIIRFSRYGIVLNDSKKTRVAVLSRDNGYFSISLLGARRLFTGNVNVVTFGGELIEGSAVYCPGIEGADSRIRPGDDVLIASNTGKLLATGRSFHYGRYLEESDHGIGISIRKKVKQ